jgi:chromosome partitioning protein
MSDYAHIIVFGNEKGGSGKSTAAIHVAIGLLRLGYKVGTLDLDARQGTFTGMMKNRWNFVTKTGIDLPDPLHMMIDKSVAESVAEQVNEERNFMTMAMEELSSSCDFVVIDTPGTHSHLSCLAHEHADTLITPVNDSMIDLSVLADIDPDSLEIKKPSIYTEMVHEARIKKHQRVHETGDQAKQASINWIVMRNRRSHVATKHKEQIDQALQNLAREFDFTYLQGFGERTIYRELYMRGLTLLDVQDAGKEAGLSSKGLTMSHISARQEVRNLIAAIGPSQYKGYRHI